MTRSLLGSLSALLLAAGTAHATPITFFDDDFAPGEWNREWNPHHVRNSGPHTTLPRDLFHGVGSGYGTLDWDLRWGRDHDRDDDDRWHGRGTKFSTHHDWAGFRGGDRGHRREYTSRHEDRDHERNRRYRNHDDRKHHDKDRPDRGYHDRDHHGRNQPEWFGDDWRGDRSGGWHAGHDSDNWKKDRFDWTGFDRGHHGRDGDHGHYVKLDREDCDDPMTPVPEPGTLLLLGSSLAGIGVAVKRRRAARSAE
jgi:hypothetical protein